MENTIKKTVQNIDKYYSITNLLKHDADILIIMGQRSNGKSYSAKNQILKECYENNLTFFYIRRMDVDIKIKKLRRYFHDSPISEITHGEYDGITVVGEDFYWTKLENKKQEIKELAGVAVAVSDDEHYKSLAYPENCVIGIFEEFLTNRRYLANEPSRLLNLISTITRGRKAKLYMIANKVSRVCPYFREWNLNGLLRIPVGEIKDFYSTRYDVDGEEIVTKISAEMTSALGSKSHLIFGKAAESMAYGEWEVEPAPHLPETYPGKRPSIKDFTEHYSVVFEDLGFSFVMSLLSDRKGQRFVFVRPHIGKKKYRRKITNEFDINPLTSNSFKDNIKAEMIMRDLIDDGKICYSDDLTAADFNNVLTNRQGGL